jgi:protocatechuate 3,4-dioxygenase beta subunit
MRARPVPPPSPHTRRTALRLLAQMTAIAPLGSAWPGLAGPRTRAPTPSCSTHEVATAPQTEGPFYKRSTPLRDSLLEPGMAGERLVLSGSVTTPACRPLPEAVLDFWQADAHGRYDLQGFRLRGHVVADADGRFRLETIVPGGYPGRTRHLHVKVQPPGGRVLTTQLYFPGDPLNRHDPLYAPALEIALARAEGAAQGRFHFVLQAT